MRLVHDQFTHEYIPTIGVDFRFKELEGANFQIWDSAGDRRFRTIVTAYNRGADALVVVVDSQSHNILEQVQERVESFQRMTQAPFFIMLNKSDLQPQVTNEVIIALREKFQVPVFQVSALTGDHVKSSFRSVVGDLLKLHPHEEKKTDLASIAQEFKEASDKMSQNTKKQQKNLKDLENLPRLLTRVLRKLGDVSDDDYDDEPISRAEAVELHKTKLIENVITETMKDIRKVCNSTDSQDLSVNVPHGALAKFREVFEKEQGYTFNITHEGPKSSVVELSWE